MCKTDFFPLFLCMVLLPAIFQRGITAFRTYYNMASMREVMPNTQHGGFLMVIQILCSISLSQVRPCLPRTQSSYKYKHVHPGCTGPCYNGDKVELHSQTDNTDINPLIEEMGF